MSCVYSVTILFGLWARCVELLNLYLVVLAVYHCADCLICFVQFTGMIVQ